jgi:pilus assembly protein CpaC
MGSAAAALLLTAMAGNSAPVPFAGLKAAAAQLSNATEVARLPALIPAASVPASDGARLTQFGPSKPSRATSNQPAGVVVANTTLTLDSGKGVLLRLPRAPASIFVADPDTVDYQTKSGTLVYVFGKTAGETVLYAVDGAGNILYSARVRVTQNLAGVRDALARHLPDDAIAVEGAGGSITLSGTVLSAAHAADALAIAAQFVDAKKGGTIVNLLAVAAPAQVNLRVRIAEVDRNVLKQFGINWDAVVNSGRFSFGLMTQNPIEIAGVFNRNTLSIKRDNVSSMIDALAQEGLITLLAQPNLTALSGETASFLAGGEFPVPVASTPGSGLPTITVVFKKFGVSLDFTPTIIDSNRINLRVRPEVSQLTTTGGVQVQGFSVPGLTVRRAETTVELGSGESFVIAGLLQLTSENTLSKVPGAGDIPIIGALLRSSRYQRHETELAIIITPYLVKPISIGTVVAAPTDGFVEANDAERILGGKFYRTPATAARPAKGIR